jgi:hypothetical protein
MHDEMMQHARLAADPGGTSLLEMESLTWVDGAPAFALSAVGVGVPLFGVATRAAAGHSRTASRRQRLGAVTSG